MNDAMYQEQVHRIQTVFDRWIKRLRLGQQDIEIDYRRDCWSGPQPMMDTTEKWRYHAAKIRVYTPCYPERTDAQIEEDVVHELVHVLMGPLSELYEYKQNDPSSGIDEFVTQAITLAILNTHQEAMCSTASAS